MESRLLQKNTLPGRKLIFWGLLLAAMILKYSYYGFQYFPVIDDHNIYGIFHFMTPLETLIKYHMYTVRPAASMIDTFIISRLWDHMAIVLYGITLLHFISCLLLDRIFEMNRLSYGMPAVLLFALIPYINDGGYWIAASSRIVIGLFFAVLSFYLLSRYLTEQQARKRRTGCLIGFWILNLISMGFYEQVSTFSFAAALLLILAHIRKKAARWALPIPLVNIGLLAGYYRYFQSSTILSERGQLVQGDFLDHTWRVLTRVGELMTILPAKMLKNGTVNGLKLIFKDGAWIYLILSVLLAGAFAYLYSRESIRKKLSASLLQIGLGILLVLIPYGPFFLLESIWIVHRNAFISFIGIGLILEALINLIFPVRKLSWLRGGLAGLAVFICLLGNAADISDYRSVNEIDRKIVDGITQTINLSEDNAGETYLVLNTKTLYIQPTYGHFINCSANDWGLTGAIRSINTYKPSIFFIPAGNYKTLIVEKDRILQAHFLGMNDDLSSFMLEPQWREDGYILLFKKDGSSFGTLVPKGEKTYLFVLAGT